MKIIATGGCKRFTAQVIADEVGMTAGGLFRHFKNMDEILDAVVDQMETVLFESFPPLHEAPWLRLHAFFCRRLQVIVDHPHISRLLLSDHIFHLGGGAAVARVKVLKQRSRTFVSRCFQEAADRGELASDVSVGAATVIVLGAILTVGRAAIRGRDDGELEKLSIEVWSAIERMRCFD